MDDAAGQLHRHKAIPVLPAMQHVGKVVRLNQGEKVSKESGVVGFVSLPEGEYRLLQQRIATLEADCQQWQERAVLEAQRNAANGDRRILAEADLRAAKAETATLLLVVQNLFDHCDLMGIADARGRDAVKEMARLLSRKVEPRSPRA